MLWLVGGICVFVWLVLKFLFHQSGYVHLILVCGISLFVVQFAAERRTRYQRYSSK
jgi:Flp pilus assembly protein TadB